MKILKNSVQKNGKITKTKFDWIRWKNYELDECALDEENWWIYGEFKLTKYETNGNYEFSIIFF